GTPPGPYRLEVRVYSLAGRTLDVLDARGASLGRVYRSEPIALERGPGATTAPSGAPPLALVEASVGAREVDAGGRVPLSLLWQAGVPPGRDLGVLVALGRAGTPFTAGGGRPARRSPPGAVGRDRRRLLGP